MKCPDEIAEIILQILQVAILDARAAGWSSDAERAAIEADHVHNLPNLLLNYEVKLLDYYWDIERPCYISAMQRHCGDNWKGPVYLWQELERTCPFLKTEEQIVAKNQETHAWYEQYMKSKNQ